MLIILQMSQTQTGTPERLPSANKELFEQSQLIRSIGSTDAYRLARNHIEGMTEKENRLFAIRESAADLKQAEQHGEYLTLAGHQYNIVEHLTTFIDDVKELSALREEGATRHEKIHLIESMAAFNRALKDMVDNNPSLRYDDVFRFLRETNQTIHGQHTNRLFENEIRPILSGIRNELAAEQMMLYMDGVTYEEASLSDDLVGGDIRVSLDGTHFYNIDIKASYLTAERKREADRQHGSKNIIVWSHANPEDFAGGFHLPREIAKQRAPELYKDIRAGIMARRSQVAFRAIR